jgi:WD40 repeat protein
MKAPAPDTLKQVKDFGLSAIAFGVARLPRTDRVFFGSSDFKVREADLSAAKFEPKELYAHESYVTTVALAGTTLISGGYDGKLAWWDTEKKALIRTTDAHAKWIRQVRVSPDGKLAVSVADDMLAKVWDAESGKLVRDLKGHAEKTPHHFASMLYACAFSPDGKQIATADKTGKVIVWETATGKQLGGFEAPVMYTWDKSQRLHSIGGIRSVAFSPDGTRLAVGGMGKVGNIDHLEGKARIELFEWPSGKRLAEVESDKSKGLVNQLRWAPDGSWLLGVGGAGEGCLLFLDAGGKKLLKQEKAPMHVHDAVLSETADSLLLAGHNKLVLYKLG